MSDKPFAIVSPMMVREFIPTGKWDFFGGVFVMDTFDVAEVGLADMRLDYDTDRVDCSQRIFQITCFLMMAPDAPQVLWCFPSRRWRNLRVGEEIVGHPSPTTPLLYIGNPIMVSKSDDGIDVIQTGEFVIKTGVELGY